ncbi:dienelactone hydrolase family protein [Aquihabitans sp. McL0605]|uniref:dienelactone hydrolase family protein n=1 Tax=Aquihabitans sp. McL0605 TaxID=3415671 RepID=UPI003CF1D32D
MTALAGYDETTFTFEGKTRTVFRRGSGPAVLVISEIPGITPLVADFGRRVDEAGFTAVLPSLFGTPGREVSIGYVAQSMGWACVSKEFSTWARNKTSPATHWAKALARHEHEQCGGPGVGVVGMCLTGNFALAMMVDPVVAAPVLSQPSLPFMLSKAYKRDVNLSPEDLAAVKARCEDEDDLCVLGLRFTGDKLSPQDRFARLTEELGDSFIGVEIDSSKGNAHGIRSAAHSVLTEDLVDEAGHPTQDALNQVLDLFRTRLAPAV